MKLLRKIHRKISLEKRHELIQIYLNMGFRESQLACVEAGVSKQYAILMAREEGLAPKKIFKGGGDIAHSTDHNDPRWKWAISRGAVTV